MTFSTELVPNLSRAFSPDFGGILQDFLSGFIELCLCGDRTWTEPSPESASLGPAGPAWGGSIPASQMPESGALCAAGDGTGAEVHVWLSSGANYTHVK